MDDQSVTEGQFGTPERDAHRLRNGIIWAAALLLLLLAIGLAVPDLRGVLHRVAKADPTWLIAGVALEVLSCLGYVAIVRLVLRRYAYERGVPVDGFKAKPVAAEEESS